MRRLYALHIGTPLPWLLLGRGLREDSIGMIIEEMAFRPAWNVVALSSHPPEDHDHALLWTLYINESRNRNTVERHEPLQRPLRD